MKDAADMRCGRIVWATSHLQHTYSLFTVGSYLDNHLRGHRHLRRWVCHERVLLLTTTNSQLSYSPKSLNPLSLNNKTPSRFRWSTKPSRQSASSPPRKMLANPGNLDKRPTPALEPRHLRTSPQPIQQADSDNTTIHTSAEAREFLLVRNLILERWPITLNNLATTLLHIAEAKKDP